MYHSFRTPQFVDATDNNSCEELIINVFHYHPHMSSKVKTIDAAEIDSIESKSTDSNLESSEWEQEDTIADSEQRDTDVLKKENRRWYLNGKTVVLKI